MISSNFLWCSVVSVSDGDAIRDVRRLRRGRRYGDHPHRESDYDSFHLSNPLPAQFTEWDRAPSNEIVALEVNGGVGSVGVYARGDA